METDLLIGAQSLHLCPTLTDYSGPGSTVIGFPRQEHWSVLPFPCSGDLPDPGMEPGFPALQAVSYIAGGLLHCRWIFYP